MACPAPASSNGKEPACQCRRHKSLGFDLWVGKIPWRRKWQPTPVSLPRVSQEQRSLKVKVVQSCLTLFDPMDYTVPGIFQARILEWVPFPFSRGSSQPRDRTQVSGIVGRFFTTEPQGSPRILEWVASLCQRIFPTQETSRGLLHCRQMGSLVVVV